MFSRTTMELSTSIPIPSKRPAVETMLIVMSIKYMANKVIITETGIARAMMIVLLNERRKTIRTKTARIAPTITEFTTSPMVCSIASVVSYTSTISMSVGRAAFIVGIALSTLLAAWTEFLPLCFCSIIRTQGSPSR